MVLEDGRWLLASFQLAPSIFDNPLVERAAQALYWGRRRPWSAPSRDWRSGGVGGAGPELGRPGERMDETCTALSSSCTKASMDRIPDAGESRGCHLARPLLSLRA